jgi:hypothetical protein
MDFSKDHILTQFQFPAENFFVEHRLVAELCLYSGKVTLDRATVASGEYIRGVIFHAWMMASAKDYTIVERELALLEDGTSAPPSADSPKDADWLEQSYRWADQKARLSWVASLPPKFLECPLPERRAMLFESLGATDGHRGPDHPASCPILHSLPSSLHAEDDAHGCLSSCFDLLVLSLRSLLRAYGDFNGGLLSHRCAVNPALVLIVSGVVSDFFESHCGEHYRQEGRLIGKWYNDVWRDISDAKECCRMVAMYFLLNKAVGHVLQINDAFGSPIHIRCGLDSAFSLESCMRYYHAIDPPSGIIQEVVDRLFQVVADGVVKYVPKFISVISFSTSADDVRSTNDADVPPPPPTAIGDGALNQAIEGLLSATVDKLALA